MFTDKERWGVFQGLGGERPAVMGPTGPIFHHFSWARSRLEMTAKVRAWGHRHDRDWCSLINREFSSEFSGTDFVHGYRYETVADIFGLENRS